MKRKILCLFLACAILLSLVGCKDKDATNSDTIPTIERDSSYFSSQSLTLNTTSVMNYSVSQAVSNDTTIALILEMTDLATVETVGYSLYLMDLSGTYIAEIPVSDCAYILDCLFISDHLLSYLIMDNNGQAVLQIIDINTLETTSSDIIGTTSDYIRDYMYFGNQWYFMYDYQIDVYTDAFVKVGSISIDGYEPQGTSSFYIDNNSLRTLLIADSFYLMTIDVENLSLVEAGNVSDYSKYEYTVYGGYVCDMAGIYRMNVDSPQKEEILDWNQVDVPPSQYPYNVSSDFVLSDDSVLLTYSAVNSSGSDDIVLLTHQDENPNANKKILEIGGYYLKADTTLLYAQYEFNVSNTEYRIQLVDFSEKYPYSDQDTYLTSQTEMLTDFAKGDAPDLYYGNDFNYSTWGKSGMVLDLSTYMDSDPDFDSSLYLDNILALTETNGSCYCLFPSFSILGFVARPASVGNDPSVTISEVMQIGETFEGSVFVNAYKTGLVNAAIQYSLSSFYDDENQEFSISEDDFQTILEYGDHFGALDTDTNVMMYDEASLFSQGQLCFANTTLRCAYDFKRFSEYSGDGVIYIGIPSVYDSARVCVPNSLVAISSGASDPSACWEFIKILLSDTVQTRISETEQIPILKSAMENQISKAMDPTLQNNADKVLASLYSSTPMTSEDAQGFRDTIDSLNTIFLYDGYLGIILQEESNSYFIEGKPLGDVITSMESRINLYLDEQWYGE